MFTRIISPIIKMFHPVVRSFLGEVAIFIGGNTTALIIHYMQHVDKWLALNKPNICILIVTSLIIAGAETIQRYFPEDNEQSKICKKIFQFFMAVLITIMITAKPT